MIRIDVTEDLTYSQGKRSPIPDACGSEDHGGKIMGYEISVDHAEIHIVKENFGAVLNAIASIPDRMAWTELADIQRIAKSGEITEMFDHLGWPAKFDSEGDIIRIEFDSSKMGDEEVWLGAIAPYVESGCIQVRGEDGDLWRWVLSGGKLKEIRPEIRWPEEKE